MNKLVSIENQIIDCANIKKIEPRNYGRGAFIEFHTLDKLDHEMKTDTSTHYDYKREDPISYKRGLFGVKAIRHAPTFNMSNSRESVSQKGTTKYNYEDFRSYLSYFKTCELCGVEVNNKAELVKRWLLDAAEYAVVKGMNFTRFGMDHNLNGIVKYLTENNFFNKNDKLEYYRNMMTNSHVIALNKDQLEIDEYDLIGLDSIMKPLGKFIAQELLKREKANPVITVGFEDCLNAI